ncbi:MAG: bifunctional demethylmenaquinone methyltransferase/2-methoxy-6-polyprenyl-1,4-benzoquinol methylase UbiE [Hyphomicrobiaceae bacterium]
MTDPSGTADFGFRTVGESERQGLVNEVFARVADRYDLMNDVMSGGMHRMWKGDLVNWLMPPRSAATWQHLDVAGGTGDVALRVIRAAGPGGRSIICDISGEMLAAGRRRLAALPEGERISFAQGNAETLPFPDRSIDAYTIAFGIRNVTHIDRALAEAYRVLKPGGRFLCLEFSQVQVPILDNLYDAWSFRAIPGLGKLIAGDEESYRYLVESIRRFPNQDRFKAMIAAAGFERVQYRNLSGGIAALHSGWRI